MGNILNKALERGETDEILVNMARQRFSNYRDKSTGETLLIKACRINRPKTALELIKRTPIRTLGVQNKTGDTALIWAIRNHMEDVALNLVCSRHSNPLALNHAGETALSYAFHNHMEKVLINLVDLTAMNLDGLVIKACKKGMSQLALKLIELDPSLLTSHDARGTTALIMACYKKLSDVALAIIATGRGINWMVNERNETALLLACKNNMSDVAMRLIESGDANASVINKDGLTALMIACSIKMGEVALALVKTGEAKEEYVYNKKTALMLACNNGLEEVALEMLKAGRCDGEVEVGGMKYINVATKRGQTALSLACQHNLKEVAMQLLEMGAMWTATMSTIDSPLIWACKHGMKRVSIKLLEKNMCNVFKKDEFGNTARYYTLKHGKRMEPVLLKIDQILKDQVGPRVSYRIHKIKVGSNQCCICAMEIDEQYALIGCGHSEICLKCIKHLRDRGSLCPICRLKFEDYVRVY